MSGAPTGLPSEEWRPGNQAERTALAWMRTSIALLVTTSAAVRLASIGAHTAVEVVGLAGCLACLLSLGLWWRSFRRTAETPNLVSARILAPRAAVAAAVAAVAAAGLAGAVLAVASLVP